MLLKSKRLIAATAVAGALSAGAGVPALIMSAAPASAQQSGLVNVDIHNVLNNNNVSVAVPVNAAANICGVSVNVLTTAFLPGPTQCTARGNQTFTVSQ